MKTVQNIDEVVVALGGQPAWAIYSDIYKDQIRPTYRVMQTPQEAIVFAQLLSDIKNRNGDMIQLLDNLRTIGGEWCGAAMHQRLIYEAGEWLINPERIAFDDDALAQQELDHDWFDAQREHFASLGRQEGHF